MKSSSLYVGMVSEAPVTIEFCYVPKAYITVSFPIHIYLPSLISWPYFVNLTADTKPGRLGELIISHDTNLHKGKEIIKVHRTARLPKIVPKEVSSGEDVTWSLHQTNRFLLEKDKEQCCLRGLKVDATGMPWSNQEEFKSKEQLRFMNEVEGIKKQLLATDNSRRNLLIDENLLIKDDYYNYWDDQNKIECNETVFHSHFPRRFTGRTMKFIHDVTNYF